MVNETGAVGYGGRIEYGERSGPGKREQLLALIQGELQKLYFPLSWLFEPFLATLCCEAHYMQWLIEGETTAYSG